MTRTATLTGERYRRSRAAHRTPDPSEFRLTQVDPDDREALRAWAVPSRTSFLEAAPTEDSLDDRQRDGARAPAHGGARHRRR